MTPLLLDIVMHYYCRAEDYRDGDFSAPAVREGIDWLRDCAGLIEHREGGQNMYKVTEKGRVYIDAILATPLPVQKWEIPSRAA